MSTHIFHYYLVRMQILMREFGYDVNIDQHHVIKQLSTMQWIRVSNAKPWAWSSDSSRSCTSIAFDPDKYTASV